MNLNEYEWSGNPRGMHWDEVVVDIDLLSSLHMGWVKVVSVAGPGGPIAQLAERGITPIARIYRPQPGNTPATPQMLQDYQAYIDLGVKWFELYNEPNLSYEWPPNANFDPRNPAVMGPLMDNWLAWAEWIIDRGCYPGLPALSEADGDWEYNGLWTEQMLLYCFDNHYDRFRDVLNNGAWIATHPYVLNHFYQRQPGGRATSARPPEQQNSGEGGWHFEYPYDPIAQSYEPGLSVWGQPKGVQTGLIAAGLAFMEKMTELFGVGALPVVGTEGGLFVPKDPGEVVTYDTRYPPYTWWSHAHATLAMFDWLVREGPPWMFGVTLWTAADYFRNPGGLPPVVDFLRAHGPSFKTVPPLAALTRDPKRDGSLVEELPTLPSIGATEGPAPLHGTPTYHMVYVAPETPVQWLYDYGFAYWDRFRPTLLKDLELIGFLTAEVSAVLTVICTQEELQWVYDNIRQRWLGLGLDIIPVRDGLELGAALNERVQMKQRFR